MKIECKSTVELVGGWSPEALRQRLEGARSIVMTAHTNADGDAVGSLTGMYAILRRVTQAELVSMLPDGCPEDLAWLPHTEQILNGKKDIDRCREAIEKADLIVAMDLSTLDRTGVLADLLQKVKASRILFDHHVGPDRGSFEMVMSDTDISSTCELIFWTMSQTFGMDAIGMDAATSLYTGICTDTGTFSYSNRNESLYLAAACLSQMGIDPMEINHQIKNVFSFNRLQFFGYAMSQLLTEYPAQEMALMVIRQKDMDRYKVESSELTGLVNEVMKLRDIDCAILIREEEDRVRLSLRSKSKVDVNQLSHKLFDGGGHERAAGATSHLSLDATVEKVKKELGLK
ncbi:MAG: DHH family phosphoesterase [Bacteroidales bacterium]|nr:DHH family phosphoesterase [Bacteroidales bacterium]